MATTAYPFDPLGTSTTNRVQNEQHVITAQNFRDYHYFIPDFAPFVTRNFEIKLTLPSGAVRNLIEGIDYYFSNKFRDASLACAVPVFGSISFLDTDTFGIVNITYNTIGGIWTLTPQEISRILAEEMRNPRTTTWEQVTNVPAKFPVVDHPWDLVDLTGAKELIESTDRIAEAVLQKGGGSIDAHLSNFDNPHQVTKAQVGLGSVQNYSIASTTQASAGTSNTLYMTPLRTVDTINATIGVRLTTHTNDSNNPHATTAAQVGLGNVGNFSVATEQQARDGVSVTAYMTPFATKQAIAAQSTDVVNEHIANTTNPHNTTKTQVGLSNVENFAIATQEEARLGTSATTYMTPQRTRQLVVEYVTVETGNHVNRTDNPHQVTKAQVGLGSVQNYGIATQVQAQAGTSNVLYMTPLGTRQAIDQVVNGLVTSHLNNVDNPHGTTATQVGLGNVQNYAVATIQQAQDATATNVYMTPALTKLTVTAVATPLLSTHTSNIDNPHQVTKAQVGLASVENFGIATTAQAQAGVVNNAYMTPLLTKQAIAASNQSIADHITNTSNPHSVTKAQVGLGSVQNFGIATTQQAQDATATNVYMTPATSKVTATAVASALLLEHTDDTNNPHSTTKAQVGLGNVENYPIATASQMANGTANLYTTPDIIVGWFNTATAPFSTHAANTNNPHQVTKAQVGLSNVQNYAVASAAQMTAGTVNLYTTANVVNSWVTATIAPLVTHAADTANPHGTTKTQVGLGNVQNYGTATIADLNNAVAGLYTTADIVSTWVNSAVAPSTTHIGRTDNPHNTTKAHVGLGSVQNYGIAAAADATAGTSNVLYMTPLRTQNAIAALATPIAHSTNTSNPHSVTATQVGAYTKAEVDTKLTGYVSRTDTWVSGQSRSDFIASVLNGTAADTNALGGLTLSQVLSKSASAVTLKSYDKTQTVNPVATPFYWIEIGTVATPNDLSIGGSTSIALNHPDAYWFLSGGNKQENTPALNAAAVSPGYIIHAKNGGGGAAKTLNITRIVGAANSDVAFGYTTDANGVMRVWMKVAYGYNGVSGTNLAQLGSQLTLDTSSRVAVEPANIIYSVPQGSGDFTALEARIAALETTVNSVEVY